MDHSHAHHHHGHAATSPAGLATSATLHCLAGCAIGEFVGLAIGVSLGLNPWATMALATVLGFASGYSLGLWPLVRTGMSVSTAFRTIWLGFAAALPAGFIAAWPVNYWLLKANVKQQCH